MRLNKYLSLSLNISRRASDDLIAAKKVKINEQVAVLGNRVEPETDQVKVLGKIVKPEQTMKTYLLLNKPEGYLSSKVSQGGAPTVYELLPKEYKKLNLNIAGRLDKDSCGLILLTNDGDYLNKITHPSSGKTKTYTVRLNKELQPEDLEKLKAGIQIGDSRPSKFKSITPREDSSLEVELEEGRNRHIRRTFYELGYRVTFLQRTKLGPYELEDLKEGEIRTTEI
ncbi:MAG: rRNA synthase [Patescibacteria group bacterium]|nr:rRNA synthase [Patescibacteria group bacterium]